MSFAVNASIMFIFKKMLARGEKEIDQLLLKFVCCRFAFGFSGPPLFFAFDYLQHYMAQRSPIGTHRSRQLFDVSSVHIDFWG